MRAHAVAALELPDPLVDHRPRRLRAELLVIGFIIFPIAAIIGIIFGIIAGIKANEGQLYRYPMSISMIK